MEQTNLKEARPELWEKISKEDGIGQELSLPKGNDFHFEPLEKMIKENLWFCPIKPTPGDKAFYSISKDEIVIPEYSQFKNGESFYGTMLHEIAHSTGLESRLDRFKEGGSSFGSTEYAKEELVAELTSAITAANYGIEKQIKSDSIPYVRSWLDALGEDPNFIKSILPQIKKASEMITGRIDEVKLQIEQPRRKALDKEWGFINDIILHTDIGDLKGEYFSHKATVAAFREGEKHPVMETEVDIDRSLGANFGTLVDKINKKHAIESLPEDKLEMTDEEAEERIKGFWR